MNWKQKKKILSDHFNLTVEWIDARHYRAQLDNVYFKVEGNPALFGAKSGPMSSGPGAIKMLFELATQKDMILVVNPSDRSNRQEFTWNGQAFIKIPK